MPRIKELPKTSAFMTAPQAARLLGVTNAQIYALCDAGEIPHFRVGKSYRIHRDALLARMGITKEEYLETVDALEAVAQ